MRVLALIAVAGCGRFGFDPMTSGDGPAGDDAHGAICSPAVEVCDGIDNDCDLQIDEVCPCTPFFSIVPVPAAPMDSPPIAWTGTGYLVGYVNSGSLSVTRIGADGGAGSAIHVIGAGSEYARRSTMTFTGSRILTAWGETSGDRLATLLVDGTRVGTDLLLETPIDQGPAAAWNGTFAALAFHEAPGNNQRLNRYNELGSYKGGVSFNFGTPVQDLAWHGAGFAISVREATNPRAVLMSTFDAAGQYVASGINVSGNRVGFVEGRTTGFANVLGSAWLDSQGLWIVPHDASGVPTAAIANVEAVGPGTNRTVGLAWSGSSYYVVTTLAVNGSDYVRLFRRTAAGISAAVEEQFPATAPLTPLTIGRPTIRTASANRIVVAWTQTGASTQLIVVQRCQ